MFKNIVSELSFSPASVGQLSVYAARLQKQQKTRVITLLVLLALVLGQLLISLSPSTPPYRSTPEDILPGGFASSQSIRETYETNGNDYGNLLTALGFTKDTISHIVPQEGLANQSFTYIMSRMPQASEYAAYHTNQSTYYLSKLATPTVPVGEGWTGYSNTYGNFFITKSNGGIFLERAPSLVQSVVTLSHTVDKVNHALSPGDQVAITLTATNTSDKPINSPIIFTFHDLSEYATITNPDSGIISLDTHELIWPQQTFRPNETKTFHLAVTITTPMPTKPYQASTPSSQDCTVTIVFGNRTDTPVNCPLSKQLELSLQELPRIHPELLLAIYSALLILCAVLYGRTRLYIKEIRIIRKQLNTGEGL